MTVIVNPAGGAQPKAEPEEGVMSTVELEGSNILHRASEWSNIQGEGAKSSVKWGGGGRVMERPP